MSKTRQYLVGPKGQIVVAKELRHALGVEPGWLALERLVDGHLEVYFVPPEHNRSLAGILASQIKATLGASDWHEVREAAWEAAAREELGGSDALAS